ncbi:MULTISPECIES: hypothetical protein [unclassified Cellulophaga]|uniref:hypothetical protein n=1 Tax=unclassified Cellulophaga TaxID=2634405 RepID=UPI0026E47AF0|nr:MULTISPECIES: hypothetical protein [unclassified Cellulophaga]MDO6490041.1 hypothetical protein [Cellulophaga sp. 2_MG-2023]MDO6494765.1 hypothetical protein [Cellulophaga sp. 3_MG-2023]
MKKSSISVLILSLTTTALCAQQKNQFKLDPIILETAINKTYLPQKKDDLSNTFASYNKEHLLKYKQDNFLLTPPLKQKAEFISKMPVHKPKGKSISNTIKIDSTVNYSLRIIKL